MARIRTIKPEIWVDEKFVELSPFARLLFMGLLNFVDDEGREKYSEKKFKMQILPADDVNISELFGEIRREKMIDVYEVDNVEYLQVVGFKSHQKIDKRRTSKYPSSEPCADPRRLSTTDQGSRIKERIKDQGKDQGKKEEKLTDLFEEFWKEFPNNKSKAQSLKAYKSALKKISHEELVAGAKKYSKVCGSEPRFIKHASSWLNGECWLDEEAAGYSDLPGYEISQGGIG